MTQGSFTQWRRWKQCSTRRNATARGAILRDGKSAGPSGRAQRVRRTWAATMRGSCGDPAGNIPSCLMFICTLIEATRRIRLGTGTINMPNNHPAAVAANVAMLDHMLDGRFIFGISPGGLMSDAEVFGNLDADRNAMFLECINQVLEIWESDPPYNIKGKYWNVALEKQLMLDLGQGHLPKPLQRPHPPIVVTAVAPFSKGVTEAAARGWDPISANFLMPQWVKSHWPKYAEGCERVGRPADPANWRVAKSIFVADDDAAWKHYATDR